MRCRLCKREVTELFGRFCGRCDKIRVDTIEGLARELRGEAA